MTNIDSIISYCKNNNTSKFNFDNNEKLKISVPATFEIDGEDTENQLLYCKVKLFHTGVNRNKSSISYETAKKCLDTIKYKPLLANFCEIDGVEDFTSHDMYLDDDNKIVYVERQIGCFTADKPTIEKDDEKDDRYYVYAKVAIPRIYTNAASIIERKDGTKVSAEITVNDMSYDAKTNTLILDDIEISGATCLGKNPETGKDVVEGMEGARLDPECFSTDDINIKNSDFSKKLIEVLENISNKLDGMSDFNNTNKEGGKDTMNHFEELLIKYNKTVEDIDFEYDGMTDEDLDAKFSELFDDKSDDGIAGDGDAITNSVDDNDDNKDDDANNTEVPVDDDSTDNADSTEGVGAENYSIDFSVRDSKFSISLDEIQYALTELVNDTYADDGVWYYCKVYDDDLVMIDSWSNTAYRQKYKKKKKCVYSLIGDRVPVKAIYVTDDEEKALEEMKAKFSLYEDISIKLDKYEKEPEKIEVLESDEYSSISTTEEFCKLKERDTYFDLTVDEIKQKADEILLSYAKCGKLKFSSNDDTVDTEKIKTHVGNVKFTKDLSKSNKPKGRYGSLFQDK